MNFDNPNFLESKKSPEAKSCTELLLEFERRKKEAIEAGKEIKPGVELKFLGLGSQKVDVITPPFSVDGEIVMSAGVKDKKIDAYNGTTPFEIGGKKVIAQRVEPRGDEFASRVYFFEQDELTWKKINDAPVFLMQDPFIATVDGETIIGGVEVSPILPGSESKEDYTCRTIFYKGKSLDTLKKFTVGPENMKDIRIIELKNGHIGVFTRPQGGINGLGQIAYIELDSLTDLIPENILKAKVIKNLFIPTEWGGANQLHLLPDGTIGVIGHIACFDEEFNKIYYAISFIFDPKNHMALPLKIIATRDNFPESEPKKPSLRKVIFPAGIDGKGNFYAGLGDAGAGRVPIDVDNLF
ncbi:MAG: DUF1861 family protein [Candidatus Paceibacterota bacterium]